MALAVAVAVALLVVEAAIAVVIVAVSGSGSGSEIGSGRGSGSGGDCSITQSSLNCHEVNRNNFRYLTISGGDSKKKKPSNLRAVVTTKFFAL